MVSTARVSDPRRRKTPRLGRADRSPFSVWFWEIDHIQLLLVVILLAFGLIAVAAASPAAVSIQAHGGPAMPPLYYFWRQAIFVAVGLPLMLLISTMPVPLARRLGLFGMAFFSVLLAAVPFIGFSVNGAQRWIGSGAFQLQPSEFLKPFYIVTVAWLLSLRVQDPDLPVVPLSGLLTAIIAALLMKQPDFGQTVIFCTVWMTLLLLSGASLRIIVWLGMIAAVGLVCAYLFYPVANQRINDFIFSTGDGYQTGHARATMMAGGVFGTGPGSGIKKYTLSEGHTDYIFSVIAEEFGLATCFMIAVLFLAIVMRVMLRLLDEEDHFKLLASAGLTMQLGLQAFINMAVNVGLAPSKGMTLPFISYGGSSLVAVCAGVGLLLAFTRRNPYLNRSPYVVKWNRR